jgi:hypothetical protein
VIYLLSPTTEAVVNVGSKGARWHNIGVAVVEAADVDSTAVSVLLQGNPIK